MPKCCGVLAEATQALRRHCRAEEGWPDVQRVQMREQMRLTGRAECSSREGGEGEGVA